MEDFSELGEKEAFRESQELDFSADEVDLDLDVDLVIDSGSEHSSGIPVTSDASYKALVKEFKLGPRYRKNPKVGSLKAPLLKTAQLKNNDVFNTITSESNQTVCDSLEFDGPASAPPSTIKEGKKDFSKRVVSTETAIPAASIISVLSETSTEELSSAPTDATPLLVKSVATVSSAVDSYRDLAASQLMLAQRTIYFVLYGLALSCAYLLLLYSSLALFVSIVHRKVYVLPSHLVNLSDPMQFGFARRYLPTSLQNRDNDLVV